MRFRRWSSPTEATERTQGSQDAVVQLRSLYYLLPTSKQQTTSNSPFVIVYVGNYLAYVLISGKRRQQQHDLVEKLAHGLSTRMCFPQFLLQESPAAADSEMHKIN